MDNSDRTDPQLRDVEKFYARIRKHLDDIEPAPAGRKKPVADKLRDLKDNEKYGEIEEKELKTILENYNASSDKPVKCDRLMAGSFAKLLYSKPGFHHPSSTDYLVESLNIKDHDRDTFLGGHSTYATPNDISLEAILKHRTRTYIKNRSGELLDKLDKDSWSEIKDDDVKEVYKVDPNDGNALAVRGKYNLRKRQYTRAVADLKEALNSNCDYTERVKHDLGEAYYQRGLELFAAGTQFLGEANMCFREALDLDPNHEGAKLHLQLSMNRLEKTHRPFGGPRNTFFERRR